MLRFLLPAFAMTAALIVLFAGALGDLHSWPNLSDKALTIIAGVAPSPAPLPPARTATPPAAPAAAVTELQAARDAQRRQVADLQRQAGEPQQRALAVARRGRSNRSAAAAPAGAASAELQAKRDALQRQIADLQRQSGELQQQVAQRSNDLEQSSHELDAARSDIQKAAAGHRGAGAVPQDRGTADGRFSAAAPTTSGPSAAVAPEQQAPQDELRRQNADLQQQVTLRSRDLDAARAETSKLRQDIEALNQLRKTQEEQAAAAASAQPPAPGPSAAAIAEQQAAQDALRRQIAELQQQVAQRSHDLETANAETGKLRQDNDALNQLRKTQEQQIAARTPVRSAAAIAEQQAAQDALRRQAADLQQQVAQRSHDLEAANAETDKLRQDIDALNQLRKTQEQQIAAAAAARPPAPGPSAAAIAEQQAAQDTLRRQNADLQQQVAQRSHDLDAANAETGKLRQDIDALNQLRKTQEQQLAAAAAARPPAPGPSAAAIAEQQAAQDALRRQVADLQQQAAQRSHDLDAATRRNRQVAAGHRRAEPASQDAGAADRRSRLGTPPAPGPSAAAIAEQQAAQDALRRQIADLQQQVAQRSHDLDAAHAETGKLRQDIDALNQLRKTQEQQLAAAASARPPPPRPSAARNSRRRRTHSGVRLPICSNRSRNVRMISIRHAPKPSSCAKASMRRASSASWRRQRGATEGAGAANGRRCDAAGRTQTDAAASAAHTAARDAGPVGSADRAALIGPDRRAADAGPAR